jgi:eukaryotic-like serine/threonine-protein kinase
VTEVAPAADKPRKRSRNRAIVVTAVASAVVIAVALAVASMSGAGQQDSATGQTGDPARSSTDADSAMPGATPISGAPTAEQIRQFIRDYYALFPGHVQQAWRQLSPRYQAKGGLASFERFYAGIASVRVNEVTVIDSHTARANLEFVTNSGGHINETYRFNLVVSDGRLLIDNGALVKPNGS